mmetsp:Transcript_38159/g.71543  ORF Transcript_38159/g.71543 Transcript_38159/m.71543 type:complete len:205 (+) Transcript_38159:2575-3189(+)
MAPPGCLQAPLQTAGGEVGGIELAGRPPKHPQGSRSYPAAARGSAGGRRTAAASGGAGAGDGAAQGAEEGHGRAAPAGGAPLAPAGGGGVLRLQEPRGDDDHYPRGAGGGCGGCGGDGARLRWIRTWRRQRRFVWRWWRSRERGRWEGQRRRARQRQLLSWRCPASELRRRGRRWGYSERPARRHARDGWWTQHEHAAGVWGDE